MKPDGYDTIPRFIQDNIIEWSISFNKLLKEESWATYYFTEHLPKYDLILVTNQSALERFMLLLWFWYCGSNSAFYGGRLKVVPNICRKAVPIR